MASRRRAGGSRRTTRWVRFTPAANTIAANTPELTTVIGASDTLVGATILRVVGSINWIGTTVDTAAAYFPALFVGPSTLDAADLDSAVDTGQDWLWWGPEGSRNPAYDGVDSFVEHPRWIDLRGRRKFSEGDALFFAENMTGTGGVSFTKLSILVLNP